MGKWTEVDVYTGLAKKMDEDAPTVSTGTAIAGTGDDSSVVVVRKKKKKDTLIDARSKEYKQHRAKLEASRQKRQALKSKVIEKIKYDVMQFNRESLLADDNMDILKNIVETKSAKPLKFSDGSIKVDLYTASAITEVYDKLKSIDNKQKIMNMVNGKKEQFTKIAKVVMGMVG